MKTPRSFSQPLSSALMPLRPSRTSSEARNYFGAAPDACGSPVFTQCCSLCRRKVADMSSKPKYRFQHLQMDPYVSLAHRTCNCSCAGMRLEQLCYCVKLVSTAVVLPELPVCQPALLSGIVCFQHDAGSCSP